MATGRIFIGVGGWTFEPWRGTYYPQKLTQKRELEHMGTTMTGVEVNGTFYGSQKPESFRKWHDEVPADFMFTLKGTRYATNKKVLADASESVLRFTASGIVELKDKLGPINWQLAATKKFDPADFGAFLKLLPATQDNKPLRHALEARHESFANAEAVALARENGVALITGADAQYSVIADPTADFVYLRLQGTSEDNERGYSEKTSTPGPTASSPTPKAASPPIFPALPPPPPKPPATSSPSSFPVLRKKTPPPPWR